MIHEIPSDRQIHEPCLGLETTEAETKAGPQLRGQHSSFPPVPHADPLPCRCQPPLLLGCLTQSQGLQKAWPTASMKALSLLASLHHPICSLGAISTDTTAGTTGEGVELVPEPRPTLACPDLYPGHGELGNTFYFLKTNQLAATS